ncbi:MAG: NAD-binding protein, partial [Selenomonadaceae bacterium]|nr:NAD-binding protein [Selenomonadaceae bacterium]
MERKNFAVLGLGRFGKNVALTLEEMGYNVLGVDKDENVATEL